MTQTMTHTSSVSPIALTAQARRLFAELQAGDPAARARLTAAFADRPEAPTLGRCLHAIAVENGFADWRTLKARADAREMDRDARVAWLRRALHDGAHHVVEALLELDPTLAEADFGLLLALCRREAALARLDADPALAVRPIAGRRPISHLAFSRWLRRRPELREDMLALAQRLVAAGADVNEAYEPWQGAGHRLSALYGALCHADNPALAEWLLLRGADPNDGESLYHATELEHLDALRMLMAHGVRLRGTNAFYRMLDFDRLEGARMMLDYGADPNEPARVGMADYGNALHHAIRRGRDGRFAELLLAAGADPDATCFGHTAYGLAHVYGASSMIEALKAHGQDRPLTPEESFMSAVAGGEREAALAKLADDPGLTGRLHPRVQASAVAVAMRPGGLDVLRLMREVGIDFALTDESGLTPLHGACWHGRAEHLPFLLSLSPDLEHRNAYGGTALSATIHGSVHCPAAQAGDHALTALLLLEAGAAPPDEPAHLRAGSEEVAAVLEEWRARTG